MVKVVEPDKDFELTKSADEVRLSVRSYNLKKGCLMQLPMALLLVFGWMTVPLSAGFVIFSGPEPISISFLIAGLAAAYYSYRLFKQSTQSNKWSTVVFDRSGLVLGNDKYLYENITSLGYDSLVNDGPAFISNHSVSIAAANMTSHYGYYIYIEHGSKRVPLVQGLTRQSIDRVYAAFQESYKAFAPI